MGLVQRLLLAPLYLECGERERYLELQEKRIEALPDPASRHTLLVETAEAAGAGVLMYGATNTRRLADALDAEPATFVATRT